MDNKKLKVTFDSNVWEKIIEKENELYFAIYEKIIDKKILPFISEKIFIYEYFPRKTRQQKFSSLKSNIQIKEKHIHNIQLNIAITPSKLEYDYKNSILLEKLNKAIKIGFKLIKLPRIGEPDPKQSLQIEQNWYSSEIDFKKGFECARFIEEELKAGFYFVKKYCNKFNISVSEFLKNSSKYNISTKKFSKILAEWADGDTIAAHYGNSNDIFCTNDFAKNAGQSSVLSEKNRKILSEKFNITFATPEYLLNLLI